MLSNKKIVDRLMALLRTIDPQVPLPQELEARLIDRMGEEPFCKRARILQPRNRIPGHAYYIVTGYVIVFAFNEEGVRHPFRIYQKNMIVVLDCFMKQYKSPFMIWACRGTSVYSISTEHIKAIYRDMSGMEEYAWKTASAFQVLFERLRDSFLILYGF